MSNLMVFRPTGSRASRVDARYVLKADATFETGSLQMRCRALDISSGGVGLSLWGTDALTIGATALVKIKGLPPLKGTIRWKKSDSFGLTFDARSAEKPELRKLLNTLASEGEVAA